MNLPDWIRQLRAAEDGTWIARALARAGLAGEAAAKSAATTRLRVRSGLLRSSIRSGVRLTEDGGELVLSASPRYARIQEEGGVVRARPGRALAIPLRGQEGASRLGAFILRLADGRAFLVRRSGAGGLVFLAVLKREVRLRPRRYLAAGIETAAAELGRALPAELEVAIGG